MKQFIKTYTEFLNENHNINLIKVIPNKFVYHSSNPIFRDKISKEGLIPQGRSTAWLSDTKIDGNVIFAVNSDNKEDWWDSTYDDDMYQIDTTHLDNKWYIDPNFDLKDKRIITFENIPLNSIQLIYKGSGSDILKESTNCCGIGSLIYVRNVGVKGDPGFGLSYFLNDILV